MTGRSQSASPACRRSQCPAAGARLEGRDRHGSARHRHRFRRVWVPSDTASPAALGAVSDSSTGVLTIYDADTTASGPSFGINLASGAVAWSQLSGQGSLEPVSAYGGAVYAIQLGTSSAPASMVIIRESDGAVTARGYQIAPVSFTDHGIAVLAQSTSPTTLPPRIGVSAALVATN
ncbi:hypothetical protein [Catenulispora rubra]|uniref:hypothetical protein n=1 Tax=Catenulispora rubra TaxID=280293 RepID=UPI0018928414|nr:hypothetical protein [Catenulispora rubra]